MHRMNLSVCILRMFKDTLSLDVAHNNIFMFGYSEMYKLCSRLTNYDCDVACYDYERSFMVIVYIAPRAAELAKW